MYPLSILKMVKNKMKKGDKRMKIGGLIVILIVVMSCFGWAAGSEEAGSDKISAYIEQDGSLFNTTEPNEVANKSICNVTLITGDVVIVSTLPNGKRGFAIKPADPTKLGQNFQIIEMPRGAYIFPEGVGFSKVDKELFNIDYLIKEDYYNLTYLSVLIDYKKERKLGVTELEELEKEINITVVKNYRSIPTFSAKLSYEGINETFKTLVEKPEIKKIWLDKKVHASLYESVPLIGTPQLWKSGYNGSGLEIAIIDTGIDDTHPDLDDLDDNLATSDPKVLVKNDFTDDNTTEDLYGHGTHCAGIAAGTGNASSLVPIKFSMSTRPSENKTQEDFEHRYPPDNEMREDLHSSFSSTATEDNTEIDDHTNEDVNAKERIYISEETLPDAYEPDDNYTEANWISTDGTKQTHNFHVSGDHNWIKFNATENMAYLIETSDLGSECDTYMYLYDRDGTTEITHDDDGGVGLASRIVWECSAPGTYYIMVRHYSSSASGPNTNYNIFVIEGYSPPAEFNDVYSDYGEDTDGDGLYDYLVVDVGVNVSEAGGYRVSGHLYENGTYNSVDSDSNTTYLSEGSQTVQLRFEGIKIRQNEYNGTYDFKSIYLYDDEDRRLDYRSYAYTTSYYNYTDFRIPPAEFNDVYSDYGTDTDGDGLYDYLVIEVGVNVTEAGSYRVRGYLYNNTGYSIDYESNTTYLSAGSQIVQLNFEGIKIRQNGVNGTFDLKSLYLYDSTTGDQLDYIYDAYTTSYYNYTDFRIPPAEFNELYSDNGTDTDGDGLYNYLTIDIGVNVTEAGNYRVEGRLDDCYGGYIEWRSNYTYLNTGNQTVKLDFEGIKIRQNEVNGTFDLKYLYLYNSSTGDQLDYIYDAYTTSYYNYTDFQEFARYIGVAPGAYLWNVKVLNQHGWGYTSWVIDGVEYAAYGPDNISNTGDEADIISMSLGGYPEPEEEDPLCQAVNEAVEQGLVVAVAAGNEYDYFSISSPGTASKVITAGASDKEDELAYFSSKGPTIDFYVKPDVLAPGVDIIAPRASGTSMGYPINEYYTRASGTSMATPHIAGAAALILQANPDWTPKEVKNALISTADDLGYNVYEQGGGRIYVPAVAYTKIQVDPATISFGIYTDNSTDGRMLNFYNLDTIGHTLTLDLAVYDIDGNKVDCATLDKTTLYVAPSSSASALLTINTSAIPKSLYSGKVIATIDTGGTIHTIFGFAKLNEVRINKMDMNGEPAVDDLVVIFSDAEGAWIQDGWTDENGTVTFYLEDETYNVVSIGSDYVTDSTIYTIAENVTVTGNTNIYLDERDTLHIDFDVNKTDQILAEKAAKLYYRGEYIGVKFLSVWSYPDTSLAYVSPTPSKAGLGFTYSYYPETYYNETDPSTIDTPEWHKLAFAQLGITEPTTFVADYENLVQRKTDYKVALLPDVAERVQFAVDNITRCDITSGRKMNAPQSRLEWLSSEPVEYSGWYWKDPKRDWDFWTRYNEQSYPAGAKTYFAFGEHPLKSGAKIDVGSGYLRIYGSISEDTFGNSFANWSRGVAGNLTVIKDGEVIIDHEDIEDHSRESVYFSGTPRFNVIIQGNSSPRLSTYTRTEFNFTADSARDCQPPKVTTKASGSDLNNTVRGGDVKVEMDVEDESNISDVTLEYSLNEGATWEPALLTKIGKGDNKPASGGSRAVVDEKSITPKYSKIRIFMDDTEDNDEIYYEYNFGLTTDEGVNYTKSGQSSSTLGDINDTLFYDDDSDGKLDLFRSIYLHVHTWDDDTLDVIVEAWNGTAWECLYGYSITIYLADLGSVNDSYVSLRANATDSIENRISQTVIKGFYVSASEECIPPDESWNVTISATNQLEPVIVGMHPNATDGYDPEYDVFAQTPVQGKVILILDDIYSTSIKRTRCYNESVSWNLSVGVPAGQTTTLSWNVPSNVNLTIREGNSILYSGVELSEGSHELLVTAKIESITFSLKLKPGWNMASLPLIPDNSSVVAIFGGIPTLDTMPVVTWESPSFVPVTCIEPKIGYWVFTPADTTITVTGKSITNTTLILEAGWNMVGTVGMENMTTSDIPNQVPQRPAVTWVAPSFVETDIIEAGKSAWVFVTTDTIITADKAVSTEVKVKAAPTITKIKSVITSATTEEWNLTISATNRLEPVTFGIHPNATNSYDEYDAFTQTPVQGKVILILDDIYATEINSDKLTWNLSIGVPTGDTTTLTWDSPKIPADVSLTLDGTDMKLHNSIELGEGSHLFVISGNISEPTVVFDTGAPANPYPSIMGNHTGALKPNHTVIATKLYTYPCSGTGGHTEYIRIYNESETLAEANWTGYKGDWHNITFLEQFTLEEGKTYNYTIRTGSYPQIIHAKEFNATGGTITCDKFIDANGRVYYNWIPAIRLWKEE